MGGWEEGSSSVQEKRVSLSLSLLNRGHTFLFWQCLSLAGLNWLEATLAHSDVSAVVLDNNLGSWDLDILALLLDLGDAGLGGDGLLDIGAVVVVEDGHGGCMVEELGVRCGEAAGSSNQQTADKDFHDAKAWC